MAEKIIGILGGMGPEATIDLMAKIVAATPARRDQDHLRIIVDNNPKIPDRTAAALEGGEDPVPMLLETARNLERAGADLIVMPCNSAHIFFDQVAGAVGIPMLHIVEEAVKEVTARFPEVKRVGVLATNGTTRLRLYHSRLEEQGLQAISPEDTDQQIIQDAIHSVKSGDKGQEVREQVRGVGQRLIEEGAELLLAACTELPLVLQDGDLAVPVVDPTNSLALAAVRCARE